MVSLPAKDGFSTFCQLLNFLQGSIAPRNMKSWIQQFLSQTTQGGGVSGPQTCCGIAVLSLGLGARYHPVLVTVVVIVIDNVILISEFLVRCLGIEWSESSCFHSAPNTERQYINLSTTGFSSLGICQSFTLVCIFLSLQRGARQFTYVYSNRKVL